MYQQLLATRIIILSLYILNVFLHCHYLVSKTPIQHQIKMTDAHWIPKIRVHQVPKTTPTNKRQIKQKISNRDVKIQIPSFLVKGDTKSESYMIKKNKLKQIRNAIDLKNNATHFHSAWDCAESWQLCKKMWHVNKMYELKSNSFPNLTYQKTRRWKI